MKKVLRATKHVAHVLVLGLLCVSLPRCAASPTPWAPRPPSKLAAQVASGLRDAVAARASSFALPEGKVVDFGAMPLLVDGAAGLNIDGRGATLVFYPGYGITLSNSSSSALHNVTIDCKYGRAGISNQF